MDEDTEDSINVEDENDFFVSKRRAGLELVITVVTRLQNKNIYNFLAVVLSILALGNRVPFQFWSLLSMMGILYSKRWTIALVKEIGDSVASSRPFNCSHNVGFGVTDNKAYLTKVTFINAHVE